MLGPAIDPAGKTAEEVNRLAEHWIETEMRRISPQFYPDEIKTPATSATA